MSLNRLLSPEQDSETRSIVSHSVLNVSEISDPRDNIARFYFLRWQLILIDCKVTAMYFQLSLLDHRVRVYIADCLKSRSSDKHGCSRCSPQAAFELAVCHTIGFGVPSDEMMANAWLEQSCSKAVDLEKEIDALKRVAAVDIMTVNKNALDLVHQGLSVVDLREHYGGNDGLRRAEAYLREEIKELERALGNDHPLGIEILRRLLLIKEVLGKTEEAEEMGWKYKLASEKAFGLEHPTTAGTMALLARLCRKQNKWDLAESLALTAKETLVKTMGFEALQTLDTCEELARIYTDRGKTTDAEKEWMQISETLERVRYPTHASTRHSLEQRATVLESLGKWDEAESLRKRAWLEKDPEVQGPQVELSELSELHNHGWFLMRRGEYQAAEEVLSRVAKEAEERLGQDHPTTMKAMRNLALTCRNQDRYAEAEAMQEKLKQTIEVALGPEDIETLNVMFDLARTYQMQGKWTEAIDLQSKVKARREKTLGHSHEQTISSIRRLAEIYIGQGELEAAEEAVLAAKERDIERLGIAHEETVRVAKNLAVAYLNLELYQRAGELFAEVKIMYEDASNDEEMLGSLSNVGYAYLCQGRFEEAEEVLLKAKEEMERTLGHHHEFTKITTTHLYRMYMLQGRMHEAVTIMLPKTQQPPGLTTSSGKVEQCWTDHSETEAELLEAAIKLSLQPDPDPDMSEDDEDAMLKKAIQLSLCDDDS
jgi:tetratricopeptide (TPR) repeat protein